MKLQPGTDKKTQGHTYNPGKLPPGAPGPASVIPVMKKPFSDRQNVSPITAPPRAGGITGGLIEQAAKQKTMNQGGYSPSQQAQMQGQQQPQLPQTKPGATGPGGGPPVAQLPQMGAAPALDPMKQAAALKFASHGAAPGAGTTPFFGTGGGQGQDPNAAKAQSGVPGLPGVPQMGGAGAPGAPGAGTSPNPSGYGGGAYGNPMGLEPKTDVTGFDNPQGLPGGPVGPSLGPGPGDTPPSTQPTMPWQQPVPGPATNPMQGPDYTKDPYPGPTDPGGLIPGSAPDKGVFGDLNGDGDWKDDWAKAEEDKWKKDDSEDWFAKYMKGSIQGDNFGPGDEWVKQQGNAIALDAEKQAAADKMKSQSMYGAAGLGGSGMAVGGMGQIDSAKNAAVTSAKADLAGQQAKLGIQDKIAQLNTQMSLAKQKGDTALQEKLATDLLKFQQQESLLNMIENAPEKAMEYIDASAFADSTQHQKMMADLKAAYEAGDPTAVLAVLMKMGKNGDGKATYDTGLSSKSTEEQAQLNQEFEAWWADYSKKMQDLGYDPGPKDFDKWYSEYHPGE